MDQLNRRHIAAAVACLSLAGAWLAIDSPPASAATGAAAVAKAAGNATHGGSLEAAATRAGETGRKVAMSLIGLAFAVAATVLAFRRDFKEAAGVFVVGVIAVLLATPAGISLLRDTVRSVFGTA
jgi:hypothetical protein